LRCRADSKTRHTVDRGASCATPSREVVLCRHRHADTDRCGCRASTLALEHDGSRRIIAAVLRERTQRFGTGTRLARARKNPRAANGGPIHVRLALGNSAVPVLRIFPAQGRIDRQSHHDAHTDRSLSFAGCRLGLRLAAPILPAGFADLVNERLIFAVQIPLLHQPLSFRLALDDPAGLAIAVLVRCASSCKMAAFPRVCCWASWV
jgi:hypothetical protein